jgi:ABC-type multidrug transport system fused ATPase/permease subunit
MHEKIRFLMAILVSVAIFLIIFVISLYMNFKNTELQFNERKAVLIKENLDLEDEVGFLNEALAQKNEALAVIENKTKSAEEELERFERERETLKSEYRSQLLEIKQENTLLFERIEGLEKKTLAEHIEEAIQKEEDGNIKKFLAKMIYNIEIIKNGGNIELDPIVVTKKSDISRPAAVAAAADVSGALPLVTPKKGGSVISVDNKYSLVVFDMGRKDGVNIGEQCVVLKGEKEVATAEIISTRYKVSAAFVYEMAYGYNINDLEKGDAVSILE